MIEEIDIDEARLDDIVDAEQKEQLWKKSNCSMAQVRNLTRNRSSKGKLSPVFFGSALTNFGVETFLEHFLKMTTSPLPR